MKVNMSILHGIVVKQLKWCVRIQRMGEDRLTKKVKECCPILKAIKQKWGLLSFLNDIVVKKLTYEHVRRMGRGLNDKTKYGILAYRKKWEET